MTIIKTKNPGMKPSTLFNMTSGANREPLRKYDASRMELADWVIFEDTMNDGTEMECVSMKDKDGVILRCDPKQQKALFFTKLRPE